VTGLSPEKGDTEGGTYVVIKGNRFLKDGPRNAKIYFGSRQGTIVRFQSDSELIVQAPGGKADDLVDVLVIFDPGGQLTIKKGFRFVDKDDTPASIDDLNINKTKKK
jgi:IPT/TIG domain